jgi:hypothetical protein
LLSAASISGEPVTRARRDDQRACLRPIARVFVTADVELLELSIARAGRDLEVIRATAGHPFWVVGRGWTQAGELRAGDALWSPRHELRVVGTSLLPGQHTVFNLEVEGLHTYFVGESAT